jgi:hypothetical protein
MWVALTVGPGYKGVKNKILSPSLEGGRIKRRSKARSNPHDLTSFYLSDNLEKDLLNMEGLLDTASARLRSRRLGPGDPLPSHHSMKLVNIAIHEYWGIAVYWALGRL